MCTIYVGVNDWVRIVDAVIHMTLCSEIYNVVYMLSMYQVLDSCRIVYVTYRQCVSAGGSYIIANIIIISRVRFQINIVYVVN